MKLSRLIDILYMVQEETKNKDVDVTIDDYDIWIRLERTINKDGDKYRVYFENSGELIGELDK